MGVLFTAKSDSSRLTSFGRTVAKILDLINMYRLEHARDPSKVVPYTQEALANDIDCSCETMSRCCHMDHRGSPKQHPTRHMIVKIIVVTAITPDLAEELLLSAGYVINNSRENNKYIPIYRTLINHPHIIPKTLFEATEVTEEINDLLIEAAEKGAPYRGSPTISSVFCIDEY